MATQFRYAQFHLNKPQDFWNNILWKDETKVEMTNCQHGGGLVLIWACFAATGPGQLAVTESAINLSVYQSILESDVRPSG